MGEGCERLTLYMQSRVPLGPGKFHVVVLVCDFLFSPIFFKAKSMKTAQMLFEDYVAPSKVQFI